MIPVFSRLKNGIFDFTGYPIDSKIVKALSNYMKNIIPEK